jgi:hypothetical protein
VVAPRACLPSSSPVVCLMIAPSDAADSRPPAATPEALERISASNPFTAAALLYIIIKGDTASSGIFFLPGIPSSAEIARKKPVPSVIHARAAAGSDRGCELEHQRGAAIVIAEASVDADSIALWKYVNVCSSKSPEPESLVRASTTPVRH